MAKKDSVPVFIEKERRKGTGDEEIVHKLVEAGWHLDIINEAIKKVGVRKPMPGVNSTDQDKIFGVPRKPLIAGGVIFLVLILAALFI